MGRLRSSFISLSLLFVLISTIRDADGCSCMPSHPQTSFCQSDFVILARIVRAIPTDSTLIYKIQIRRVYKISEKARVALKYGRLLTSIHDSTCGIKYQPGKVYAISGRVISLQARVNLCGFSKKWRELTPRQRKGLKSAYSRGCNCDISFCPYKKCGRTMGQCVWSNPCQEKHGICLRSASQTCMWSKNKFMRQCFQEKNMNTTINLERKRKQQSITRNSIQLP